VSAFARGSTLTLAVTVVHIWLRSPRKVRTAGFAIVGFVIVILLSSVIDGSTRGSDTKSNFWEEMSTMFDDSEGSTGSDRKTLWAAAVIVFKHHPILGVGAENFGPAATTLLKPGDIPGAAFNDNPNMLYARALHSNYYQLLSEYGLVGVAVLGFLLVDFWKRNKAIRRIPSAAVAWRAAGGREDPGFLALGLECGVVAFLASGYFYNQLFTSWFFSMVIANTVLHTIVMRQTQGPPAPRGRVLVRAS
jgi:O-antigen ligase